MKPFPRLVFAACLAAALSACSTVDGWFEDDPPPAQGTAAKPGATGVPGAGGAIPNLSSVPGQAPRPAVTAEERKKLVQELTADSKGAQYAEPVVKPEQPAIAPPRPAPPRTPPAPAKAAEAPKPAEPAKPVASVQMPAAPKPAEPATTVIQPPPPSTATVAPQPQPPVAAPPSPPQPSVVMQQALPPAPPPAAMSQPIPTPPPPPLLAAVAPPPATAPALGSPSLAPAAPQAVPVPRGPRDPRALETYNASRVAVSAQVGSIPFEANSARMRLDDMQIIRDIAAQQKKRGGTVRVVGFADAPVSAERAEQVARALLESGVKPERVYSGTMPANDPAFRTARSEAVPGNRRVDIYIDY